MNFPQLSKFITFSFARQACLLLISRLFFIGKSYLLFELYYSYLIEQGIDQDHIIKIAFDDRQNKPYRDPYALTEYVIGCNARFLPKDISRNFEAETIKCMCIRVPLRNSCQLMAETRETAGSNPDHGSVCFLLSPGETI